MYKIIFSIVLLLLFQSCKNHSDRVPQLNNNHFEVNEDNKSGTHIGVITIVDEGSDPIFAIDLNGSGSELFSANHLGLISLKEGASLDYEQETFYHLNASARNSAGRSDYVDLNITVNDYLNPFQIARIPTKESSSVQAVATSDDYCVIGEHNGIVNVYKTDDNGSYDQIATLKSDNNDSRFGNLIAMDGPHIVITSERSNAFYLFKRHKDDSVEKLAKVEISDFASIRSIAIDNNNIIVGEDGNNDHTSRVLLYTIEADARVTQVYEFHSDDPTEEYYFGDSIAIDGDFIAIGQAVSHQTYLFHNDRNGTFSKIAILSPEDIDPSRFYRLNIDLNHNHLLVGSERLEEAYLYTIKNLSITNELKMTPDEGDYRFGRSVALDYNTILIASYDGVSLYTYENEILKAVTKLQHKEVRDFGLHLDIEDGRFVIAGYADTSSYIYDTEPLHQIFIYSKPESPLEVYEGAPYTIYSVDAGSPDSELSFESNGIDGSHFLFHDINLTQDIALDFENPSDYNANNDYNVTISIKDLSSHTALLPLHVRVTNRDYMLSDKVQTDDVTENTQFARAVDTKGDYIIAGAEASAYLFQKDSSGKLNQLIKIVPDSETVDPSFGSSTVINENYIIIGAPLENSQEELTGAAYLYSRDDLSSIQTKIEVLNIAKFSRFAASIALEGNTIAIGAPGKMYALREPGEVYLYTIEANNSVALQQKIKASDASMMDMFGSSLSINSSHVVVGAPGHPSEGTAKVGAAYLFKKETNGTLTEVHTFIPPTSHYGQSFGSAVAMSGNYVAVSACCDDIGGSVYLYKLDASGSNATLITQLHSNENNRFGTSIDLKEDTLIVGSYSLNEGRIYHYKIETDDILTLRENIRNVANESVAYFGYKVSIGNDYIISGTPNDNMTASRAGSLYLFEHE